MISLAFICEGKTERQFVSEVLAPHLRTKGIESTVSEIGQEFLQPGGNVSLVRVERDVENHLATCDFVTTVVDFYGIARDWSDLCGADIGRQPTHEKAEIAERVALEHARANVKAENVADRFIPNVLMHEFEGLLLTSPEAIGEVTRTWRSVEAIKGDVAGFVGPEDVNSGRDTAPSKRLKKCKTNYGKAFHGARIASRIGLERLRSSCPHFDLWMTRLENLAGEGGINSRKGFSK